MKNVPTKISFSTLNRTFNRAIGNTCPFTTVGPQCLTLTRAIATKDSLGTFDESRHTLLLAGIDLIWLSFTRRQGKQHNGVMLGTYNFIGVLSDAWEKSAGTRKFNGSKYTVMTYSEIRTTCNRISIKATCIEICEILRGLGVELPEFLLELHKSIVFETQSLHIGRTYSIEKMDTAVLEEIRYRDLEIPENMGTDIGDYLNETYRELCSTALAKGGPGKKAAATVSVTSINTEGWRVFIQRLFTLNTTLATIKLLTCKELNHLTVTELDELVSKAVKSSMGCTVVYNSLLRDALKTRIKH